MDIIHLSFEDLNLTTKDPFGISYGTSSLTQNILVKLQFGEYTGFGEIAPVEYHSENIYTAKALLEFFQSQNFLKNSPYAILKIISEMNQLIAGNNSVKAGIEMALHDLIGQISHLPLSHILGTYSLDSPITDFTIGLDSLDIIEQKTINAIKQGYKILKVKQGTNYDKQIINAIRNIDKHIPIRVDANGAWNVRQAIEMSEFLANNNVQFIEQPLPKYSSWQTFKQLRDKSSLPIFADESICVAADVVKLYDCIDGVVVKLSKTGGIKSALDVINTARSCSMQVMLGCMIESSIGVTAIAQLAPLADHLDLDGALLLAHDPYYGVEFVDSKPVFSNRNGLGIIPRNT